ncbi:unnamed protein product [Protopolystoma xenopodis]|uniref:Uncharacterized protein n=1 Tax=Protopolystoma xenopodis TaxID=117903 RepID=A0A3S5AMC2_9PLAT|nr:unnamed protein product [Protopolystoma xenopodis]
MFVPFRLPPSLFCCSAPPHPPFLCFCEHCMCTADLLELPCRLSEWSSRRMATPPEMPASVDGWICTESGW